MTLASRVREMGPHDARKLIERVGAQTPVKHLAVYVRDICGHALANILARIELGVSGIDGAVAGPGGCPCAEGASGNVVTEDVETGVDLDAFVETSRTISPLLDRQPASKAARARRTGKRPPVSEAPGPSTERSPMQPVAGRFA